MSSKAPWVPVPLREHEVLRSEPLRDADVLIAVVVQLNTPGQTQFALDLNRQLVTCAVDCLHAGAARCQIIDVGADADPDYDAVRAADGILVLGGGDVDATRYGFTDPVPNEYGKDPRADEREIRIIRTGIADDAIMLHLCRGSQILNVACGGSLIPDLPADGVHKGLVGRPLFVDETVQLLPGTFLGELYGPGEFTVRNGHHQAVDRLGEGLRVAARAGDGVTEAVERTENTWIVGMQWHPEELYAAPKHRDLLFAEFLRQVRAQRAAKPA